MKVVNAVVFIAAYVINVSLQVRANVEPVVEVKNGTLIGSIMTTRKGRYFAAFRGVPYALPPLGNLRFEPPQPSAAWEGVRSAKEDAGICTQRNIYTHQEEIVGVEDCLYLNVYTPQLTTEDEDRWSRASFPILVWFHGGGWVTGAGHSEFYHPKFLLDHDVILVTLNFRLGPLGFLSTEDLVTPGNQGMKDQARALRWIHENIAAFGGDPNRVTIFGESAGGVSVHYHMMSPLSKGLFHRGISESGTALCPWGLTRPGLAVKQARRLGQLLDCPVTNSQQLIDCLRAKDARDIIGTDRSFQEFGYCPMIPFRPVVEPYHDAAFLIEDPVASLKAGRLADIPWMTGITSHEGSLKVARKFIHRFLPQRDSPVPENRVGYMYPCVFSKPVYTWVFRIFCEALYGVKNGEHVKQLDEDFENLAPRTLLYQHHAPSEEHLDIARRIREFYLGDSPIDNSTRLNLIDLYSDAWFNFAADTAVRDHLDSLGSPVYYYYFAYRGDASFSEIFGDPDQNYGVCHADELQYLFPVGEQLFKDKPLSPESQKVVDIMTSLWTNFAKSGNPTPEATPEVPIKWSPVRTHNLEYLHIGGSQELYMAYNLLPERISFWATLPLHPQAYTEDSTADRSKDEL